MEACRGQSFRRMLESVRSSFKAMATCGVTMAFCAYIYGGLALCY